MEFTKEQQTFVDYVDSLMTSGDKLQGEVLLNAPAGCGKTYLAKYFDKKYNKVVFLAPTHKAKNILKKDIKTVNTIHKFFNAKQNYRPRDGESKFTFGKSGAYNTLIIVDECSMVSDEMYIGFKLASKDNLVVYLGDDLQLPPINSEDFDDEEIDKDERKLSRKSKTFEVEDKYTLTENKRCEELCSTLMLSRAREACYNNRMPHSDTLLTKNINDAINDFVEKKDAVVLAYTNVCVNNYNKLIRSALFNESPDSLNQYYEQEILVYSGYRCVTHTECKCCQCGIKSRHHKGNGEECIPHWRNDDCNENDIKYYSSSRIIITKLSTEDVNISYDPFECDCDDNKYTRGVCKEHKSKKGSIVINFYKIVDQNGTIWYKPTPKDKKIFDTVLKQYHGFCCREKQPKYWAMYHNFIDEYDADIKYSYASTVHKSQGSQWDKVYVDRTNIVHLLSKDQMMKLSCYYTAISRMKTNVYDIK